MKAGAWGLGPQAGGWRLGTLENEEAISSSGSVPIIFIFLVSICLVYNKLTVLEFWVILGK